MSTPKSICRPLIRGPVEEVDEDVPRDKVEMADFELICFDLKGKA
jgi:hypothetical protein